MFYASRSAVTVGSLLASVACVAGCPSPNVPEDVVVHDAPVGTDIVQSDIGTIDAIDFDTPVAPDADTPDATTRDVTTVDTPSMSDGGRNFSTNRADFGLGGASHCASAGVQLCEDFERGTLDTATWNVTGTAPTIDGMHVARGSHALHILQRGNGPSYIAETRTFPATNNTYWGRMFVYFHSLPVTSGTFTYAHWTFAAASGTVIPGEIRLSGQMSRGMNLFGVGTDSHGFTGDWTTSDNDPRGSPRPVPTDQWLCIEWLHDGAANETRFFWDAVEHPSLHTTATMHGFGSGGDAGTPYILPQFNRVWVGWQEYQTTTEVFESWIDEVAIDHTRIGCVL